MTISPWAETPRGKNKSEVSTFLGFYFHYYVQFMMSANSLYPLYTMWGCVFSVYPFPLGWLRECIYFVLLLSSSNQKYELLSIVWG